MTFYLLLYSCVMLSIMFPMLTVAEELKAKQQAKNALPSRIPGARDANKKQAKYIPLDRPIPANCLPVDTNNIKFMVDPHDDLVEDGRWTVWCVLLYAWPSVWTRMCNTGGAMLKPFKSSW